MKRCIKKPPLDDDLRNIYLARPPITTRRRSSKMETARICHSRPKHHWRLFCILADTWANEKWTYAREVTHSVKVNGINNSERLPDVSGCVYLCRRFKCFLTNGALFCSVAWKLHVSRKIRKTLVAFGWLFLHNLFVVSTERSRNGACAVSFHSKSKISFFRTIHFVRIGSASCAWSA